MGNDIVTKNFVSHSALEGKYYPRIHGETTNPPRVSVQEIRKLNLLHISGSPYDSNFLKAVESSVQYELPLIPNTTAKNTASFGLWLSPNSWLIGCYKKSLISSLMSKNLNVTNVSSGRTIFRVSGEGARHMLSKGCPIDLHPEVFLPGLCVHSKINSLNILLNSIDIETIEIFVPRSFSIAFWEWLLKATLEYGLEIKPYSEASKF